MKAFLFVLMMGIANILLAQVPSIKLDKYTLDKNSRAGKLHCVNCQGTPKYSLAKGDKQFSIGRDGTLQLRNGSKQQDDRYEVTIEVSLNGKKWSESFIVLSDQFVRNKVIAHRGAWKNKKVPENALASLQAAFDLGCEGSEYDVHMSADSVLFVNHDPQIGELFIEKSNADDLRRIKLQNGEPLPLAADFLKLGMQQQKTKLVLELKPSIVGPEKAKALARKVMQEVRAARAEAWMVYISFDYEILKEILRIDPFAQCAYLNGEISPEQLAADKMFGFDYNQSVLQKNIGYIAKAKELGLTSNVWTVNDPALMDLFLKEGIDYITTNEPEILLQKVGAQQ